MDEPEIKIEYMSNAKGGGSNNERKTRLARAAKKWSPIDLIRVSPSSKPPIVTKNGGEDRDHSVVKSDAKRTSRDMRPSIDEPFLPIDDSMDADHKRFKMEGK